MTWLVARWLGGGRRWPKLPGPGNPQCCRATGRVSTARGVPRSALGSIPPRSHPFRPGDRSLARIPPSTFADAPARPDPTPSPLAGSSTSRRCPCTPGSNPVQPGSNPVQPGSNLARPPVPGHPDDAHPVDEGHGCLSSSGFRRPRRSVNSGTRALRPGSLECCRLPDEPSGGCLVTCGEAAGSARFTCDEPPGDTDRASSAPLHLIVPIPSDDRPLRSKMRH